jgi:hypothetical protein
MEHNFFLKPYFNFAFILQAKNVNGIATSTRNLYFKACSHCRWKFFKVKSPPLSLFDMLLTIKGLSNWFVRVPLAIHPSWWFLLFALTWIHPSCTFSSPFFECYCCFDIWQVFIIIMVNWNMWKMFPMSDFQSNVT